MLTVSTGTYPSNTSRVFHVERTWKPLQRRFNSEYTSCVCRVLANKAVSNVM